MSLAHRSEHRLVEPAERLAAGGAAPHGRVVGAIDFRQLARRAAAPAVSGSAVAGGAASTDTMARATKQSALDLLAEAAAALPAILARCEALESALSSAKEKSRADLEAANDVIREWQGIAEGARAQLEASERGAVALRNRAEVAETGLSSMRGDVERAQQAAAEAECLSSLFQDKVLATFGVGTPGHTILESVRNRTQQMLTA